MNISNGGQIGKMPDYFYDLLKDERKKSTPTETKTKVKVEKTSHKIKKTDGDNIAIANDVPKDETG